MGKIHKSFAVGASSLLLALALTPAALAAGTARGAVRGVAGSASSLPNTDIKGSPAHWSPTSLSAKARATSTTCTKAQASFTISNLENKAETVTAVRGLKGSLTIAARTGEYICVPSTFTGTAKFKLTDGARLTVKF